MRKIPTDCTALVLNLKKCITMDGGAMRLINMLHDKLRQTDKSLFITNYEHLERLRSLRIKENPCFLKIPEFEDAVLHLENIILSANGYRPGKEPIGLGQQQLLRGLSSEEIAVLSGFVKHATYQPGELIVKKGSHAEEIFFIESGQAIVQDCVDGNKEFTLAIISAGNSFGEMALLDKEKRSANVLAHTELTCFVMVYDVLDSEPALAPIKVKMLTNIAASLSYRLRAANNELASFT
jgi:glutaminase